MMNKYHRFPLVLALLFVMAGPSFAGELVMIVNKANTQQIDLSLVTRIYTGSALSWADGTPIAPLDQSDEAARAAFAAMIGKSPGNIKTAWANLMFSGKATPPKVVAGSAEVKAAVSANKSAIGYIDAAAVDSSVKVVGK